MTQDTDAALRQRTERLFWTWSRTRLLTPGSPRPDAGTVAAMWRECERIAAEEAVSDQAALAAAIGAVASKGGPVRLAVVEHKLAPLCLAEFKDAGTGDGEDAAGTVDGYLAVFDNTDLVHDVIHRGAFSKTLQEAESFRARHKSASLFPLLWQHDKLEPIGFISSARQDTYGLRIQAVLDLSIDRGRQAYNGLRAGVLSFSIGYRPVKYEWQGSTRHLKEIALGEGSVVTFPANPEARAISRAA